MEKLTLEELKVLESMRKSLRELQKKRFGRSYRFF